MCRLYWFHADMLAKSKNAYKTAHLLYICVYTIYVQTYIQYKYIIYIHYRCSGKDFKMSQVWLAAKWLFIRYNRLSVISDYDCIFAMLLRSSMSGSLEVSTFSVTTTSGTVSVIQRDARRNTSVLTAPGSLHTCSMCEERRWIINVPMILLWSTAPPS